MSLLYPKWIPGEHGPTGPIEDLAGIRMTANGQPVPWHRDDVEIYEFHIDVPPGVSTLDVALDFISPPETRRFLLRRFDHFATGGAELESGAAVPERHSRRSASIPGRL